MRIGTGSREEGQKDAGMQQGPATSSTPKAENPITAESLSQQNLTTSQFKTETALLNYDGKSILVDIKSIRSSLPIEGSSVEPRVIEGGVSFCLSGHQEFIVTPSGLVYLRDIGGSDTERSFDQTGAPLDGAGAPLTPRARIILMENGRVVCTPPNISIMKTTQDYSPAENQHPQRISDKIRDWAISFLEVLNKKLGATEEDISDNPVIAKCDFLTKQTLYLDNPGPGGVTGPLDTGFRRVNVTISIRQNGDLDIPALLLKGNKIGVFSWEHELDSRIIESSGEFYRLDESEMLRTLY